MFYKMTCAIGDELNVATVALSFSLPPGSILAVLDLCMAPGGFTTAALTHNQSAYVCGISLPIDKGGHEIRVPNWKNDPRITVKLLDITMLAAEMGSTSILRSPSRTPTPVGSCPTAHLKVKNLGLSSAAVRFSAHTNALNTVKVARKSDCGRVSVLALRRICNGGTLVVVLHRADAWHSVVLMHAFTAFAEVQLFKPRKAHARRSSFYMVARNVQSHRPEVAQAIERWRKQWRDATFGGKAEADPEELLDASHDAVEFVMKEFGERFVLLSRPIFKIQANALRRAPWTKNQHPARPV